MPDQYQLDAVSEANVTAEARRQEAIREAHEAFGKAYLYEKARHAAEYERASARWDALKSNQDAADYEGAWLAFQRAKEPANHTQARAELNRAIRAADAGYHAEVSRVGQEHPELVR